MLEVTCEGRNGCDNSIPDESCVGFTLLVSHDYDRSDGWLVTMEDVPSRPVG